MKDFESGRSELEKRLGEAKQHAIYDPENYDPEYDLEFLSMEVKIAVAQKSELLFLEYCRQQIDRVGVLTK
jgi:hypothetical protein